MEIEKVWSPQPKQKIALECPADELFYGGAKGGGKSDFLLADFLRGVKYGKDHRGILFRKTYNELEELQARAYEIYPRLGAHFVGTSAIKDSRSWQFPGGSVLKMRYLEREQDVHKYQGHQYIWMGFDELTNWPRSYCYIWMFSCLRSPKGIPVSVRASGNPGSVGHVWVKDRFIDDKLPFELYWDDVLKMNRTFIPAKLDDNLKMMEKDPGYETRLKALPPHLYRAYREGDWDIFAGQIFEEFNRAKHLIPPTAIDPSWRRACSFDWGYARPYSIGWWAVTHEGRPIRYREMYGCAVDEITGRPKHDVGVKMSASVLAKKAWDISVAEGCKDMVADPSIWTKVKKTEEDQSIAEIFEGVGWNMIKGKNDRVSGLARVHDYLKGIASDGKPLMLIFDTCHAFIRTIPVLVVDETNPEDLDTTGEDHVYDETRYFMMSEFASIQHVIHEPMSLVDSLIDEKRNIEEYNPLTHGLG